MKAIPMLMGRKYRAARTAAATTIILIAVVAGVVFAITSDWLGASAVEQLDKKAAYAVEWSRKSGAVIPEK